MIVPKKNLSRRRKEYKENWLIIFFKRKKKKRRIHTFKPGELFHFQIKPDISLPRHYPEWLRDGVHR
jgi:hypothetical protein